MSVGGDASAVDVDFGSLGGVDGGHEDARAEGFAGIERGGLSRDVGIEFVDAYVLEVDVGAQGVEHLALGLAHVALQLGEHGDGCYGGHFLEHVLRPVLAVVVLGAWHVGAEVGGDDGSLAWVGHLL